MKVLFDHQIFINQRAGGISRYITDLKKGLNSLPNTSCKIIARFSDNIYLDVKKRSWPMPKRFSRFINSQLVNFEFGKVDILHPTYYNIRYLHKNSKPVIITVHDLIYFKYPDLFSDFEQLKMNFSYAVDRCDGIICISDYTKKQLEQFFNLGNKPVKVIHHSIQFPFAEQLKNNTRRDYFLYVGSRHLYKNFELLLSAFETILKNLPEFKLIFVGGEPLSSLEKFAIDRHPNNLKYLSSVTDKELQNLYANASALVITSLEEGFCYPAVEALLAGTLVICPDIEVLHEVTGKYSIYFEPNNLDSLIIALRSTAENNNIISEVSSEFRNYFKPVRMCNETRAFYSVFG